MRFLLLLLALVGVANAYCPDGQVAGIPELVQSCASDSYGVVAGTSPTQAAEEYCPYWVNRNSDKQADYEKLVNETTQFYTTYNDTEHGNVITNFSFSTIDDVTYTGYNNACCWAFSYTQQTCEDLPEEDNASSSSSSSSDSSDSNSSSSSCEDYNLSITASEEQCSVEYQNSNYDRSFYVYATKYNPNNVCCANIQECEGETVNVEGNCKEPVSDSNETCRFDETKQTGENPVIIISANEACEPLELPPSACFDIYVCDGCKKAFASTKCGVEDSNSSSSDSNRSSSSNSSDSNSSSSSNSSDSNSSSSSSSSDSNSSSSSSDSNSSSSSSDSNSSSSSSDSDSSSNTSTGTTGQNTYPQGTGTTTVDNTSSDSDSSSSADSSTITGSGALSGADSNSTSSSGEVFKCTCRAGCYPEVTHCVCLFQSEGCLSENDTVNTYDIDENSTGTEGNASTSSADSSSSSSSASTSSTDSSSDQNGTGDIKDVENIIRDVMKQDFLSLELDCGSITLEPWSLTLLGKTGTIPNPLAVAIDFFEGNKNLIDIICTVILTLATFLGVMSLFERD